MPELDIVEPQKTAGFVSRSRSKYKDKIAKEEQELKELLAQREGKGVQETTEESQDVSPPEEGKEKEVPDETLSKEEKSFKTRYGDVRRHLAAKEKEYDAKIKELEDKLSNTQKLVPPKSDEDLAAWMNKYPDVAGMVETIAEKKAKQMFDKANIQIEEINKARSEQTRKDAESIIRESHKDFDTLRESDDFHGWVEEQPKWVQNALYENTDDAQSVIRVLDLYKVDNGLTVSDKKNKTKAAASLVNKTSKTKVDAEEMADTFKESDVEKMTDKQYAANAEKIQTALRSGKFIYDISGNRR
jgi:hypothetical protein